KTQDVTFSLDLTGTSGGTIDAATATGRILPPPLTLSVSDASEVQGSQLAFTVSLSRISATVITVNYATANGSATAGTDYQATSGTLSIPAGQTSATVSVNTLFSGKTGNVSFVLNLSSPSAGTLADSRGDGIITPQPVACFSDNFGRSDLGADWAITSRSGGFTPAISNGRLRLTSAGGNIATAATLQRVFPAADNLIRVEFEVYAYGGSGADGIAVTFSDASKTPQPGSFGGSLGYAQQNNGDAGFNGGWVGIGIDEYGNFSNPTEGRQGGPGLRRDADTLRGSGSGGTGYNFIAT